ncbi:unnamed protein product [Prunus brigantina]
MDKKSIETQLMWDMLMMVDLSGKERSEAEWKKLFLTAGFSHYKITHTLGLRSLIEVLSVKMVSQDQSKDSGSKKNGGKELGMVTPQEKSSKKMKFVSSSVETEPTSTTTISEDSKSGRGMSTMPRVVKRKLQKIKPIVGVLLVDKKWAEIPKDIKEQIWEAVDMAFVVGQGGKNSVLSSAAKKWKDFKSTLTRNYILPYINDRERLSQPLETYKFIEKAQWDAFVASRLSKEFESVHSQHAQIREKLEYNHRLSRKGYAGLEDQLEETMPGDELQKQVLEGKVSVSGSNDLLTMALGPEHPGRVRGIGAGIFPRQYFNLPKPQRMNFSDRVKDSLRVLLQEETKKMEAKAREEALRMEARTKQLVEAEREHFLSQLSQLIPNFDPSMLKPRISQSPKNPMSEKASCSGGDVRSLHFEDDTAKNGEHQEEKKNEEKKDEEKEEGKKVEEKEEEKKDEEKKEEKKDEEKKEEKQDEKEKEDEEKHDDKVCSHNFAFFICVDYSNMEVPSSLKSLCRYVETTLMPQEKIMNFTIDKEVFGVERNTFVLPEDITQFAGMEEIGATVVAVYMRYLHDLLKEANMCSMVGFIDPTTITIGSSRHWVLLIVRAKRETVYFLDPLPGNRVVDEEGKNIVNSAIKIYNSHIARAGRKAPIWKTLPGSPKQPSSVECGYYVMRFMRDIIMDPSLAFEKKVIVSEMDKSWMHSDRRSKAYEFGVEAFLNFAVENLLTTTHIRCPCVKCVNLKLFGVGIIRDHLYFNGVDQSYKNWTFHGEPWEATTNARRNVEEDDGHSRYIFVSEEIDMDDNDFGDFGSDPYEFANVIGDGDQPVYPGCRKYTKWKEGKDSILKEGVPAKVDIKLVQYAAMIHLVTG